MAEEDDAAGNAAAIVLAGGSGVRFESGRNKVFHFLTDRQVALQSLLAFKFLKEIVFVMNAADMPQGDSDLAGNNLQSRLRDAGVTSIVPGGARRQDSVFCGLEALSPGIDLVAIHDAARPLVTESLVRSVLVAAKEAGGAVPGLPVRDTLKSVTSSGDIQGTVSRQGLVAVQTPQGFQREVILAAHRENQRNGNGDVTDDAALVERMGHAVRIIPGDPSNIKVTDPDDLLFARTLLFVREASV